MDRISSLPNDIICHIWSFLSAKEAAFALVLSSRWRNLFTIIPKLHFYDDDDDDDAERLKDFVDGVLALPVTSRVRTFSFECYREAAGHEEQINRCLRDVLKRGVSVLKLQIKFVEKGYSLPFEVFTCKTVAKMKLGSGFAIDVLPSDAFLPALKTLFLYSVQFYNFGGRCAFKTLLSASPVLEELVIDNIDWERWKWSFTVSSPTLQRLTIRRREWDANYDGSDHDERIRLDCRGLAHEFDSISLDTPGLTYLDYTDYVPEEYIIVNLNSLVEAKLNLCVDEDGIWQNEHADNFNPINLINGFKNVEILDLTFETMQMFYVFREAIPVFDKLYQISVRLSNVCWYSIPILLEKSPNLKTLILKDFLHFNRYKESGLVCQCLAEYSFLLSCPLEVLKINEYFGSIEELEQMKHFLGKLSCLELVEVHALVSGEKELQVKTDLLMLPRASSKCKIQLKFPPKRY